MTTTEKPLSEYTRAELKTYLDQQEKEEKQALVRKKKLLNDDKDAFLQHSSSKFQQLQKELRELKEYTIAEANKLYERMFTIEDKIPKETKSFTLKNSDDTVKITVERQERFEFNDQAIVHINAIKDIFKNKFADRNKGLYEILDGLLIKGSKGEYDPKLLAKARNQVRKLGDDKLIGEFDKLDECQKVTGSALYCRLYIRDANQRWEDVSLQFSSL